MKPTQEQSIAWAREAGWTGPEENVTYVAMLERFAALAYEAGRKDENEACAKVCNELVLEHPGRADLTAKQCADAIRARREQ